MTVKSVRGRRRYTAFKVPLETDRTCMERSVRSIGSAKVITCKNGLAVIRSLPSDRRPMEEAVSVALCGSKPFDCSGTLHALRERHPELKSPRKRRRRTGTHRQTLYTARLIRSR